MTGAILTLAVAYYDVETENASERDGHPRLFWTSPAFYVRYYVSCLCSVAFRPELY